MKTREMYPYTGSFMSENALIYGVVMSFLLGNVLGNYINSRGAAEGHNQETGYCVVWKL